ncbi:MAG TPA: nuclear transport factor 2 family protein [Ilumatobacter sp.]|nr:nuclear transport factor 2 family protein [Ilumatobacter sp.]
MNDDVLWQLSAEHEIRKILARYCHAVDRADEELLRSVYHDGAFDDHSAFFRGPAAEFAPFCVRAMRERFAATMHQASNVLIEVDGTGAAVQSSYLAANLLLGRAELHWYGGRYLDRFEHRDGAWRISHRLVLHDWDVRQAYEDPTPSSSGRNEGLRSTDDPSYEFFASFAAGRPWPARSGG